MQFPDFKTFLESRSPEEWGSLMEGYLEPDIILTEDFSEETVRTLISHAYQRAVLDAVKVSLANLAAYHEWLRENLES